MTELLIRLYIKYKNFENWLINLCRLVGFSYKLYKKDIFRRGNPDLLLEVVSEFISYAWRGYKYTTILSRTPEQSAVLLRTLVKNYYETKSSTVLEQILEVTKNEFIERERNGRK